MGDLAKVGIKAKLTKMPYFSLRDKQRNEGTTPMFLMDWGSYSMNDMSAITSHFFKEGRDDFAMDDDVAKWLEAGDTSVDLAVRKENYAKAIQRITEQVYWLPMFNHVRNYAYNAELASHHIKTKFHVCGNTAGNKPYVDCRAGGLSRQPCFIAWAIRPRARTSPKITRRHAADCRSENHRNARIHIETYRCSVSYSDRGVGTDLFAVASVH